MNHTILLVDDEPNILHSLGRAFRNQPYKTYTSRSAEEAMFILKTHDIDLIVSDENMPGMSGSKLLAWVAEYFPEVVRIVLTGQPSVPAAMQAINEGRVYRYLTKPCDVEELGLTVCRALEEKEACKQNLDMLESALSQLKDAERSGEFPEKDSAEKATASVSPLAVRLTGSILVVEDSTDFQRLISCLLSKAGAEVTLADNGQVGVELALAAQAENKPFDLIFMDIQMPVLDGYGATRKLREEGYENPIVALTAFAMTHDRQKCLDAGCNDYSTKPIERETFLLMASKYCQRAVSSSS